MCCFGVESAPINLKQLLCFSSDELTVSITLILTKCLHIYKVKKKELISQLLFFLLHLLTFYQATRS